MDQNELVLDIFKNIYDSIPIFQALGDRERLFILLKLLYAGKDGLNVKTLSNNSWLSRPAISHHLKILKDAKIIDFRKEGTQIYYYFDSTAKLMYVQDLINKLQKHEKELNLKEIEGSGKDVDQLIKQALEKVSN